MRRNVLVPMTSAELGGSQMSLLRLVDALGPDEFSFRLWLFEEGPLAREWKSRGLPFERFPRSAPRTPWGLARLSRRLAAERPDLVYLHASRVLAVLARRLGIPCVERINMTRGAGAGGWARFACVDRLFTTANTKVVAVSEAIRNQLVAREVPEERVVVIRNFVDADRFHRPDLREPARAELAIPAGAVVVLGVGRLVPQKAPADFVEIAAACAARDPRLRFVLVGEGPLLSKIDALSRRHGLEGRLWILPFEREVERLYAAADLLLHTAHWEPLANVILEAMAAGLAVVATDVDGTREAVCDGESGLLFPPGNRERAVEAVLSLAADAGRRRALGERAAERTRRLFAVGPVAARYRDLFRSLCP
ncbi:MAG: glycosyltransferase family 4 protein [Planctomycetes bacterium]|nr:glycosyltransferase family 4 protein [Planctomycetota bacterium]